MDMLFSVYLIAEFQYPVGIRIPFHVQEVALAVLEAGQPLDLSLGCRLDLLVGLQPVTLCATCKLLSDSCLGIFRVAKIPTLKMAKVVIISDLRVAPVTNL